MESLNEILDPAVRVLVQAGADYDVVIRFVDARQEHGNLRFLKWLVSASRSRGAGVTGKFLTAAMSFEHPHADIYRTYLRRCGYEKPRSKNQERRIFRVGNRYESLPMVHRSAGAEGVDRKWLKVDYSMIARIINLCNDTDYEAGQIKLIHRGGHAHTLPLKSCIESMVGEFSAVGVPASLSLAYATPDYAVIAEVINQERGTRYDSSVTRRIHKGTKHVSLQPIVESLVGRWDRWFAGV